MSPPNSGPVWFSDRHGHRDRSRVPCLVGYRKRRQPAPLVELDRLFVADSLEVVAVGVEHEGRAVRLDRFCLPDFCFGSPAGRSGGQRLGSPGATKEESARIGPAPQNVAEEAARGDGP